MGPLVTTAAAWSNGSSPGSYPGGTGFDSRRGNHLPAGLPTVP